MLATTAFIRVTFPLLIRVGISILPISTKSFLQPMATPPCSKKKPQGTSPTAVKELWEKFILSLDTTSRYLKIPLKSLSASVNCYKERYHLQTENGIFFSLHSQLGILEGSLPPRPYQAFSPELLLLVGKGGGIMGPHTLIPENTQSIQLESQSQALRKMSYESMSSSISSICILKPHHSNTAQKTSVEMILGLLHVKLTNNPSDF